MSPHFNIQELLNAKCFHFKELYRNRYKKITFENKIDTNEDNDCMEHLNIFDDSDVAPIVKDIVIQQVDYIVKEMHDSSCKPCFNHDTFRTQWCHSLCSKNGSLGLNNERSFCNIRS